MFKKLTPASFIVIVVILACIVWCFVYPEEKGTAISVGAGAFVLGLFFGVFDTDD